MTVLAWHFLPADRRLAYGDGRLIRKGQTLHVEGEPTLCLHGMHGSRQLIDALSYASGPIVERVEIGADKPYKIIEDSNKLVGTWRKTLWWIDATMILHEFACREADDALRDAGITDKRCWDAVRVKRLWIQGRATNEELNESRIAASNAAETADWAMAYAAAWRAALGAARKAYWFAAMDVSWSDDTERSRQNRRVQNRRLTTMVCAAYRQQK